jgi:short-subunit dehydrogenase
MPVHLKPLDQQVMIITGASSGIGLATARAAAEGGARVVLVARNGAALAQIDQDIRQAGGEAIHVVADVGKRQELERVAEVAIGHFGGFDSWVNNAAVGIFGRLDQVSDEDHHQLFQTNFWGVVYGSQIAAAHLRNRGGALINLGSLVSDVAAPLQGMYVASKHAIKGFTDAFRMELEADGAPISVTLIKPASINTPFPQHAKNYTDRTQVLPPPTYAPEEVANAILHAAVNGGRDIYVGGAARFLSIVQKLVPQMGDLAGRHMISPQLRDEAPGDRNGALYEAGEGGQAWGREPGYTMRSSLYTRASMHPVVSGALAAAAGLTAYALIRGNGRGRA